MGKETREKVSGWALGPEHVELHLPYFDLCSLALETPSGDRGCYNWVRCTDWIKVVPVTENGEIVLVDQFRPINSAQSLEVPGGAFDQGESDPIAAAKRELLEETGYSAKSFVYLGSFNPNPALFRNHCHVVLAEGAFPLNSQSLEPGESMSVVKVSREELLLRLSRGEISHALVRAALLKFLLR